MSDEDAAPSDLAVKKRVYGRPFQKGQSGNPTGRSGAYYDLRAQCKALAPKALEALQEAMKDPRYRVQAAAVLLDRGYGKAIQRQEHTGADGGPIQTQQVADERMPVEAYLAEFQTKSEEVKH